MVSNTVGQGSDVKWVGWVKLAVLWVSGSVCQCRRCTSDKLVRAWFYSTVVNVGW